MRLSDKWQDYCLIDTSDGERLERWGDVTLIRPDPQIIWKCSGEAPEWRTAHAKYNRLVLRRRLLGLPQEAPGELADKVRGTHIYGEAHRIQAHRAVPGAGGQLGLLHERNPRRRPPDKRAEPVRLHRRSYARMRCGGSLRVPCGRSKGHG